MISAFAEAPARYWSVHYACEALDGGSEQLSPRVLSIAVQNLESRQGQSFSVHSIAEELGVARDEVAARFADIEAELLKRFFSFVRKRKSEHWVHWKMRSEVYGFEHLASRYRALRPNARPELPDPSRRLCLPDLLEAKYGPGYARPNDRMGDLLSLNASAIQNSFLRGRDEPALHAEGRRRAVHNSVAAKVDFFAHVLHLTAQNRLRVRTWSIVRAIDGVLNSRFQKVAALLVTSTAVGSMLVEVLLPLL